MIKLQVFVNGSKSMTKFGIYLRNLVVEIFVIFFEKAIIDDKTMGFFRRSIVDEIHVRFCWRCTTNDKIRHATMLKGHNT